MAMKNGACTSIWSSAWNGLAPVKKRHHVWKQALHLSKTMLCIWWDWEKRITIMNCLNETKWSMRNSMFNRLNDSTRLFKRKDLIGSRGFFCCLTMPALISPIWPRKPFKCMAGKCCHTHCTLLIWHQHSKGVEICYAQSFIRYWCRIDSLVGLIFRVETGWFLPTRYWKSCWTLGRSYKQGSMHCQLIGFYFLLNLLKKTRQELSCQPNI